VKQIPIVRNIDNVHCGSYVREAKQTIIETRHDNRVQLFNVQKKLRIS